VWESADTATVRFHSRGPDANWVYFGTGKSGKTVYDFNGEAEETLHLPYGQASTLYVVYRPQSGDQLRHEIKLDWSQYAALWPAADGEESGGSDG
jgi:hypothetical protein